jgi:Toxin with endonuclease activity, of toxin-antitoxin system
VRGKHKQPGEFRQSQNWIGGDAIFVPPVHSSIGLPHRYRLFFRAFSSEDRQVLIVLWLGYPRKAGDKRDCYEVFTKMVGNGDFPDNLQELLMAAGE